MKHRSTQLIVHAITLFCLIVLILAATYYTSNYNEERKENIVFAAQQKTI